MLCYVLPSFRRMTDISPELLNQSMLWLLYVEKKWSCIVSVHRIQIAVVTVHTFMRGCRMDERTDGWAISSAGIDKRTNKLTRTPLESV